MKAGRQRALRSLPGEAVYESLPDSLALELACHHGWTSVAGDSAFRL